MKKIMFSDKYGLTQAVIEGQKTMTRRLIFVQAYSKILGYTTPIKEVYLDGNVAMFVHKGGAEPLPYYQQPMYKIGEVVAIAQSYKDLGYPSDTIQRGKCVRKGNHQLDRDWDDSYIGQLGDWYIDQLAGWNNKMFVLPEMCNYRILFTGLKAERLQGITSNDCLREGIIDEHTPVTYPTGNHVYTYLGNEEGAWFGKIRGFVTEQRAFASLINNISGQNTWKINPWSYAYTFELEKGDRK